MNSYPPELVNHHFACMLVSGLTPPSSSSTTPSQQQQQQQQLVTPSPTSSSSSETNHAGLKRESAKAAETETAVAEASSESTAPYLAFPTLCKDLTEIFNSRGRSTLWDPSRGRAAVFHSVLVDHNVRLPPQKTRPNSRAFASSALQDASASALSSLPPRSPLSPLHPASPLFPDGLIAPIWTRKHRELVPSVYVAFHCLAEVARPRPAPGQDGEVGDSGESLRRKDEELIRIIAERKRSLTERGIKLTVVLLTSRTMLENPQLEARLSYVRRSSGLDSKASLFVLTPVSKSELSEFVTSLQGALYDSALDYYREHARRVKRKRARYPPPPSVIQPILTAALPVMGRAGELVPLSREGWIVRAEYKLATFAELQGDNEEALSRYIEAYNMLSGTCLGSTMMLPPRTKRWAEAKVLADTLNIKIAKLHLYNDDGQAAMRQLQRHLHRFTELSTGWGIGTMTFEFWSWLCKQYRMFADLIDSATRGVASSPLPPFQLPLHAPPIPSRILHPDAVPGLNGQPSLSGLVQPNAAALASGTSPASIVQGAGPFYYLAALCTMERRERFRRMVEVEEATKPGSSADSPALMHEQKVDHTGQITEQLTRSYDSFKRSKLTRLSLMVASKIAMAYMEASQHEMSLRFLERITKSYRRDGCDLLLAGLLSLAAECAIVVADVESLARILFETLPTSLPLPLEQRANSEKELQRVLTQMELPAEKDPIRIDFKPHDGILSIESVFIAPQVEIGSITGFQVRLTAPKGSRIASIRFNMLEIQFEGWERPIIVKGEQKDGDGASEIIDLGNVSADEDPKDVATCLNWSEGSVKAVQGSLNMREAGTFRIQSVTLKILGKVPVELNFDLQADSVVRSVASEPRWLIEVSPGLRYIMLPPREQANVLTVKRRNYKINVRLEHQASAYLEEYFPIRIHCKNEDQEALQCYLDAFLQPAYEGGDDVLLHEEMNPSPHLRGIPIGRIEPEAEISVTILIKSARQPGNRVIDFFLRSIPPGLIDESGGNSSSYPLTSPIGVQDAVGDQSLASVAADNDSPQSSEKAISLVLPVKQPFGVEASYAWSLPNSEDVGDFHRRGERLLDLDDEDEDEDEDDDSMSEEGDQVEDGGAGKWLSSNSERTSTHRRGPAYTLSLCAELEMLGEENVEVESVRLVLDPRNRTGMRPSKFCDLEDSKMVQGIWMTNDRFSLDYMLDVFESKSRNGFSYGDSRGVKPCLGRIEISWKRLSGGKEGQISPSSNLACLNLPMFERPAKSSPLVVVCKPKIVKLDQAFSLYLKVVNPSLTYSSHDSPEGNDVEESEGESWAREEEQGFRYERNADDRPSIYSGSIARTARVTISIETNENFTFSGPRKISLPHLLPDQERRIHLRLVPTVTGEVSLPRIKAWDDRSQEWSRGGAVAGSGQEAGHHQIPTVKRGVVTHHLEGALISDLHTKQAAEAQQLERPGSRPLKVLDEESLLSLSLASPADSSRMGGVGVGGGGSHRALRDRGGGELLTSGDGRASDHEWLTVLVLP